jgi:hypothetical protein
MLAERIAYEWADSQVGDIVVIHDIEMHHVGTCIEDIDDFFAKAGEIG